MQRSLYSGVSGMSGNQLMLDTIANNLSNLNTPGFKGSRVSFASALNQTSFAGGAPGNNLGGINPVQVGLGSATSSIDVDTKQGALETTGRTMDLAVQGTGYFQLAKVDASGNISNQYYTRVGNFGFDSLQNLVDLATGLKVMGKQTDVNGNTLGQILPVDMSKSQSLDAVATQSITFQGNLSSADGALQGTNLKSVFPLTEVDPSNKSSVATENTILSHLAAFNTANGNNRFTAPSNAALLNKTIYIFGTKPNGDAYAGQVTVAPWTDTVADLVNKINNVMTQGNDSFGLVTVSNGTLTANGIGTGNGFSLFMGENNPISGSNAGFAASAGAVAALGTTGSPLISAGAVDITTVLPKLFPAAAHTTLALEAGALAPTFTFPAGTYSTPIQVQLLINGSIVTSAALNAGTYAGAQTVTLGSYPNLKTGDTVQYQITGTAPTLTNPLEGLQVASQTYGLTDVTGLTYTGNGVSKVFGSHTVTGTLTSTEAGLLNPSFTVPAADYSGASGNLKITIKVNGKEVGGVVPTGDLTLATAAQRTFSLKSFPHVKIGDVITYELSGNKNISAAGNVTWTTNNISDQSSANLTADINLDGIPDMFQEGSSTDVNAWQYQKTTNDTLNWYKFRMAPNIVASSIQVYDSNGGSHVVEARFFRTGTRSVQNSTSLNRYNGWDMMLSIKPEDGTLTDDLVSGLQFDQQGRFMGSANLGNTIHGTALNDANIYVGTPVDNSISVNWATTGTANIKVDLGNANSTIGLTGFGTADTGAAINQDGSPNGQLQTLSVSANGNIVGLYSNGKSMPLYQIQLSTFSNPSGLTAAGTNLWSISANSGDPIIREPGTAGSGTITSGALEGSNVDIASEFTRLITAQRGYQVNAKIIQTTDQMLQELASLKQ